MNNDQSTKEPITNDNPLKCCICKDFYKNPVILNSCKHSFCLCCLERSEKNIERLFELPKKSSKLVSSDKDNNNNNLIIVSAQEVKKKLRKKI